MRLDQLSLGDFEPRIGQDFQIRVDGLAEPLDAELVEVEQTGGAPTPDLRAPFSLVFRGPVEPILTQGTYELTHAEMGSLSIFIVPIARSDDGVHYQAVFS